MSGFALFPAELRSLEDLARLACALEKVPKPVLAVRHGDGYMVGVIGEDLGDGSLLFLYHEEPRVDDYLCYRFDSGRELAYYSQEAAALPTLCAPVVKFRSLPIRQSDKRGRKGSPAGDQLLPVEVEDDQSVVKMGLYRLALEESPGAIYYMPCAGGILASFIRASEDNGPILFLHHRHQEPEAGFIKVNLSRMGRLEFAASPSEPGYVYVKLARLKACPDFVRLEGPEESPPD
ncbi:MAG: hypothetical protein ACP5NG_01125 [Conexivisphaera sp.]